MEDRHGHAHGHREFAQTPHELGEYLTFWKILSLQYDIVSYYCQNFSDT